jgi:hypothetical protein
LDLNVALFMALVAGAVIAGTVVYRSGRTVPGHVAARLYLWQRVKGAGLDGAVSAACVNELADRELARAVAAPLTERLDALAIVIGRYAQGHDLGPALRALSEILERHGVRPPPVESAANGAAGATHPGD